MPYLTTQALLFLRDHPSESAVLAPRREPQAPWEPMLARYDAGRLIPALDEAIGRGHRSFQQFLAGLEVWPVELTLAIEQSLVDWDTPGDVVR